MPDVRALLVAALIIGATGTTVGCAGRRDTVEVPDAPLGRVIIYRNGVAYFERKAVVEGELTLNVPRARVDDFLKSLTIIDAKTGKSLPISYPTVRGTTSNWVKMRIELPKGKREVLLAYVTESPAWKPSYRVILGKNGMARLQSWAIVDNVSGETWTQVRVGVGSTSALSFRYDLHSVQVVERETIDGATKLAQAPPKGGSPYAVGGDAVRVLGEIDSTEVASADATSLGHTSAETEYRAQGAALSVTHEFVETVDVSGSGYSAVYAGAVGGRATRRQAKSSAVKREKPKPPPPTGLQAVTAQLGAGQHRVRVEGYALASDADRPKEALRRANTVREALVKRGISADRIDVIGHETLAASKANVVRVVAVEDQGQPTQARATDSDGKPRGSAHFLAPGPMTIEAGHSAMVTLFDKPTKAKPVYLYDPVSTRGSKAFAFNAVRIENPSEHTLDSGPITVYAKKRFLGEGLTEPIPPKSSAIVPFGLDRSLVVRPEQDTREEIEALKKIDRGIATTQTQRIRRTRLEIANRGMADAKLFVRHRVPTGWTLRDPPKDAERMGGDMLIPVRVTAGKTVRLVLEESMPITTAIDLRSRNGLKSIEVFLAKGELKGELVDDLEVILAAQRQLKDVEDKLASRKEHMHGLRDRVTELTDQLVALRKVSRAQSLSGHLAKRARQLGNRLDGVAAEVTDLETQRLKQRIELGNLVAELTLAG